MNIDFPQNIIKGTFSIPKSKDIEYINIKFQRITLQNEEIVQFAYYKSDKVFHENVSLSKLNSHLNNILEVSFNSLVLFTNDFIYSYKISSKGKVLSNKKANKQEFVVLEHNKKKNYLLTEGEIIPPLVDIGVMTPEGKIIKAKSQKFKQINRFLEIIEDSIKNEQKLKIIDFGCGKSYLSFIVYYYLTYVKKIDCEMIGLDLKKDVVENCNKIAKKYNYDKIHFVCGDISNFQGQDDIDMIITLHACDTATDYALYHAINLKCRYIFSVPCCQHEINLQLSNQAIPLITNYGILKERLSAIYTDAIRANILQYFGYKTQVLEFIDFDASPKNLLIRATYTGKMGNPHSKEEIEQLLGGLGVNQTLYNLLFTEKKN